MKRNIVFGLLLIALGVLGVILICKDNPAKAFKKDYESINGKENAHGKIHRVVEIDENNPFVETSVDDILDRINNKETFYVYFGSTLCPWCRSTIEKAIEVSLNHGVSKIYYVDIWDDEGNEIVRDKYTLDKDNKPILAKEGKKAYYELLKSFDSFLSEYTLTNDKGEKISVNEKRIFAPNYIYVENGVIQKLVTGISSKQKDSREELTKEMLEDEEKAFDDFFSETCHSEC